MNLDCRPASCSNEFSPQAFVIVRSKLRAIYTLPYATHAAKVLSFALVRHPCRISPPRVFECLANLPSIAEQIADAEWVPVLSSWDRTGGRNHLCRPRTGS